jgi:SagB-type dehydrogenase family enzyme
LEWLAADDGGDSREGTTMNNDDTQAARRFHDATKYVLVGGGEDDEDILMGTPPHLGPAIGAQDPAIEPLPYKIYSTLEPLPLPDKSPPFTMPALDAVAATGELPTAQAIPGRDTLASLCLLSNGILKRGSHGTGRVIEYRAAGGTGARYHLELYLVCGDLPGLDAGVYHYGAHDHALRPLRRGDYRSLLAEASGAAPAIVQAPAIVVATSTFWRNAWRYQARAYRHVYWDLGTTLSNLLAVAAAADLPAQIVMGFAEPEVNRLLAVDGERESAVALVALGRQSAAAASPPPVVPLDLPTRPISAREIVFPEITAMHTASSLASGAEAAAWRGQPLRRTPLSPGANLIPLHPLGPGALPDTPIDAVIRRRRSTRHYATDHPLPFAAFSTLLDRTSRGIAMDCLDPAAEPLNDQYLIVNNVEQLDAGTYVLHPRSGGIELLAHGNMQAEAARLACAQHYAAEAHVNVYYLADLEPILERYGNRGYRVAQLEAALHAGKVHLAAHALGLGAVGSTAVDDEVIRFFSPHAAGKSYMFVIVFGLRRQRSAGA